MTSRHRKGDVIARTASVVFPFRHQHAPLDSFFNGSPQSTISTEEAHQRKYCGHWALDTTQALSKPSTSSCKWQNHRAMDTGGAKNKDENRILSRKSCIGSPGKLEEKSIRRRGAGAGVIYWSTPQPDVHVLIVPLPPTNPYIEHTSHYAHRRCLKLKPIERVPSRLLLFKFTQPSQVIRFLGVMQW